MKKKLFAVLTALFMILSMGAPAYAANGLPYVVDNADLLTEEEEMRLEEALEELSTDLQFDIVVVTTDSLGGSTPEAYADDYYDYTGYGQGVNHDGCLLLVSMEDRDWHLSTTGYGITALTDAGISYLGSQFVPYLSEGAYLEAFATYAYMAADFVQAADSNGEAYDYYNLNEYDSSYGEGSDAGGLSILHLGIGLLAGFIIALIVVLVLQGQLKSVHNKAEANEYLVDGSLVLTGGYDRFVTTHVTKTARESKSGGSSTHSGSSGTSHGGGGGKF